MSHPTIESTPPPPAPSSPFISPDQASTQTESGESTVQVSFSLGGHPSGIVPYAELARQRQLHQQQQHVHEHEHWQPHAHTNTDAHTNTQALDCQRGSDTPMTDVSKATSITSTSTSTSISTPVSTSVSESTALVSAPYANGLGSQRVWTQGSFNTEDALDNNSSYNSNGGAAIDGDSGSGSRNITRLGCTSVGEEAEVHAEKPAEQHVAAAEREYQYLQNTYLHNQYRHTDMHMGQKRDQQQSYPTQIQAQVQRQGKMDRATRGDQEQADVGSVASNNKIEEKYSSSRSSYDNATVDQCRIVGPKTTVDANNAAPSATIMTQKPGTHSHGSRASSSAVSNISFEHKLRCTVPLIPSHPMTSSSTPTPTTPTLTVPKTPAPPVAEDEYSSLLDTEHSLPDSNLSPPSTSSPSPMLSTFTTALSDPDKLSKPSNATATVTTTIATTSIEPSATTPATTAESKQPSTSTMDGLEPVLHTTPQSDLTAATTAAIAAPAPSDTVPKMSRVHPAIAQPQKKPIQPQPLHENVKATFAVVADLAGKESWATKERFPPHLRGPLFECAKVALAVRTTGYMIEDHFFVHLQTILPYNKFTLKKLIYKNILPEWIRELQTQKEGLLAMFKKRVHADALALGLSTEFIQRSENNVSDDSRKTLTWTPGLRLLLWEIVEKYMEIRAANKELHLIDSKTFPPHRPESQTKKDAYETLLQSFPAGCMTSAEISRQYSQLKEKVTSQKKATTENQDSQPVSSICSTSSANGVQRRSLSVATPTELLPLENRNHSVTAATPLESALASTNTTSYRPPSPEDSPATTPMMHLLDRRSSEMSTGRHQNLSTDEEMQQGASKYPSSPRLSSQEDLHRLKLKDQQIQTQEMQPKLVIERSQQEQELWNQRMSTQTNPRDETTRLPPIPPQTPSNVQTWNERTESMRRKEREKEEKRLLEEQERRVMMQAEILLREQSRLKELREQQQERQREQAEQKLQRQKEMQLKWKQEEEERRQKEEQRQKEMEAHLSKEELWVLEQHKKEKELERQRELRQAEQRWKEEQQLEQQRRMQEQMSQWHPRSTSKVRTIKPQGGMTLSQLQAHHQDSLMDPKATNHDRLQMGSVPEHQSSHRHSIQDQPTRQSRSSYPQRMHPYQSPHPPRLDQDRNEAGTRFQPTGPNERQAEVMSPRGPSMTFIRQSLPAEQGRAPASILTQVKIAEQTLGHPQERDYRPVGYPALPPKEYKAAADEHRRYEYLHFSQHRTQQQRVQDSSDQSDGSH
ncbi:hypothetical protein BGZ50_001771 [Haplosporangium sp. Z 11]|nr:hypothetical protein BGZ50_001771 [Haplosporangium sp. Z 11]